MWSCFISFARGIGGPGEVWERSGRGPGELRERSREGFPRVLVVFRRFWRS